MDQHKPKLVIGEESFRRSGNTSNLSIYTKCFAYPLTLDGDTDLGEMNVQMFYDSTKKLYQKELSTK